MTWGDPERSGGAVLMASGKVSGSGLISMGVFAANMKGAADSRAGLVANDNIPRGCWTNYLNLQS